MTRQAKPIEIEGGPHDGMQLDVQERVVGLVVITRDGDEYTATWSARRGSDSDADLQAMAIALAELLIDSGWVIQP